MKTAIVQNKLLTPIEAADYLNIKPQTLAVWRVTNRHGLPFTRVGHLIRYRVADLERWLACNTVSPDH